MKPNAGTNLSASSHSTPDNEQLLGSYRNCESLTTTTTTKSIYFIFHFFYLFIYLFLFCIYFISYIRFIYFLIHLFPQQQNRTGQALLLLPRLLQHAPQHAARARGQPLIPRPLLLPPIPTRIRRARPRKRSSRTRGGREGGRD